MDEEEIKQAFKELQKADIESIKRDKEILMLIARLGEKVSELEKLVKTN